MKKHWTFFLKEAGTITKKGEMQNILLDTIEELQNQIQKLKLEYEKIEFELTQNAKEH